VVLPPDRGPAVVSGISPEYEPELYEAASELSAWIWYLLRPDMNDGPRIYRKRGAQGSQPDDLEEAYRVTSLDAQDHLLDTVSVLEEFAGDPDVFVRPAQAVSGVLYPIMDGTYDKLAAGVFTWSAPEYGDTSGENGRPITDVPYPEMHPARLKWMQMRNGSGWSAPENHAAFNYEEKFVAYAVYIENSIYVIAEHLARYRAIYLKAGKDVAALMTALTEKFANPPTDERGIGVTFDLKSILITAVVAAATSVIGSTATAAVLLGKAATSALGDATKNGTATTRSIDMHARLRDTAQEYLDGVHRIDRETADAIADLTDSPRSQLAELGATRREVSAVTPHIRHELG
jgi:hypothetical protein